MEASKEDNLMNNEINMFYRYLGDTGIKMSTIGFGCAGAWGKSVMGKPMITDKEAEDVLEKAYELGITWFDTGYNYGFAEERLGRILEKSDIISRDKIVLSTKFGERLVDDKWIMDWSPEWMRMSVETSLERLKTDHLDLLMCHGGTVSEITPELIDAMHELKTKGMVRAIGTSMCNEEMIKYVIKTKCFDFVMLRYNILMQTQEPLIRQLTENGIGVLAGAPLAESLYSNDIFKIRRIKDLWYLARAFFNFRGYLIKGRKFTFINDVPNISAQQIALKYVLDNLDITAAVIGTTSVNHLENNVKAREIIIPEDVLNKIKSTR